MLPYPTPPSGGGLYVIRLSDNHYYGGRTKAFTNRWAVHYRLLRDGKHFNAHAQAVFNQHGRFEPEVLCVTSNEGGRRELEGLWLQGNVGKPGCVNLSRSADGVHVGYTHSEATRVKHRRPVHTDESKEKCRQAARRPRKSYTPHPHTEESRAKLSASLKRVWAREKEAGVKRAGFGGTHSDEARAKISAAKRGRPHPHTGVSKTQEQKDHQSQAMLDWWSSLTPEEREAHASKQKGRPPTKGMTGRKHTPETKRRMSEARRARTSRLTPESKP
jgi:hypothetical protein